MNTPTLALLAVVAVVTVLWLRSAAVARGLRRDLQVQAARTKRWKDSAVANEWYIGEAEARAAEAEAALMDQVACNGSPTEDFGFRANQMSLSCADRQALDDAFDLAVMDIALQQITEGGMP